MTRSVENLSVGCAGVKNQYFVFFLSYYYLTLQDLLLKFSRYMYLYFIKAYVEGNFVSYRGLVMNAPKQKKIIKDWPSGPGLYFIA